jgi:MFS family permease
VNKVSSSSEHKKRTSVGFGQTFYSLRHPSFRLLWTSSLLEAASGWIQQVTLGWLAYDLTGSALAAGLVFGVRSLPSLLIGPIGGVFGDRFERKKGLLINSGYMSVLGIGFALLLAFGEVQAWHILLFTFLQGVGQALVGPVRQALVSNTVPKEDLMNAIALNSFAQSSMRVIGPAIAGGLIALSGPALNFGIQGAAYFLTFLLVIPLRTPYGGVTGNQRRGSFAFSFVEGVKYVRHQPTIIGLLLMAFVPTLFTTPINLGLLPVIAKDVLHVDSSGLGILYSAQGVGAVTGTLTLATLGSTRRTGLLLSGATISLTLAIAIYSQVTVYLLALPILAMASGSFMTYMALNQTLIQTITPDEFRGRVMGLYLMNRGTAPLGSFVFGTIAEVWGVKLAMEIAGFSGLALVLLILVLFPTIPRYRSSSVESAQDEILVPQGEASGARAST